MPTTTAGDDLLPCHLRWWKRPPLGTGGDPLLANARIATTAIAALVSELERLRAGIREVQRQTKCPRARVMCRILLTGESAST